MTTEPAASRTLRVMGATAHVIVTSGGESLLDQAEARLVDLESRWSRFRLDSELSRLNRSRGLPVLVSSETFEIVARAVDAWFLTAGRFDPTESTSTDARSPGCAEIVLGHEAPTITLPTGTALDLGGIGQGLAADVVAEELMEAGAVGACVSIGGDLRCMGAAPWPEGWLVDVQDPNHPDDDTGAKRLVLADGAVVTSIRRTADTVETAERAETGPASVTVLAGEAWWGEVFARAVLNAGVREGVELLTKAGLTGFLVDDDGVVHHVERLKAFSQ